MSAPSVWRIEFHAAKDLRKLGAPAGVLILRYLREWIATAENPRRFGRALTGDLAGLLRYRIGDYRIIATFEDDAFVVLVLRVAHRREVYD